MTDETVPITIRFPAATYERLRRAAFDGRTSMNAIVVRGTEAEMDALAKHDPDTTPKEQDS